MKKFLALLLAAMMVFSLVACGGNTDAPASDAPATDAPASDAPATDAPATLEGKIALVTDVGTIDDESFNQATWQGVEAYAKAKGLDYQYYQPAADSTPDRMNSIAQAVKEGANVIVVPGYLFGEAMLEAPAMYPDVKFIAIDVSPEADMGGATPADNLYCAVFAEEQAGFLAGYGAVKDGYTSLGFLGGMAVPAVQRYGSGYVQGISAAAEELGVDVTVKYTYGGQFFGDATITAKMEGWNQAGTEIVFACGGGIWTSAVEAALNNNAMVIGVDVDQHYLGNNTDYAYNPFVTSAMKGLQAATESALSVVFEGDWSTIGGTSVTLGLTDGDDVVGLPTAEDSWGFKTFTLDEYKTVLESIKAGTIEISKSPIEEVETLSSHVTLDVIA